MIKISSKLVLSFTLAAFLVGAALLPAMPASAAATPTQQPMTHMMDKDKMMCMMQSPEMKPMMLSMMKDMMMSPEMKPMMMNMMKEMMQSPEMKEMMMSMKGDTMPNQDSEAQQQPVDHSKHQAQ